MDSEGLKNKDMKKIFLILIISIIAFSGYSQEAERENYIENLNQFVLLPPTLVQSALILDGSDSIVSAGIIKAYIDGLGGGGLWSQTGNFVYPTTIGDSVGIGTATPTKKLDVAGSVLITPSGATTALTIDQDNNADALNIDSEATTSQVIDITGKFLIKAEQDIPNGYGLFVFRDIAEAGAEALINFNNDNAANTQSTLNVRQEGTGLGISIDQNGNNSALDIDSEATSTPALKIEAAFAEIGLTNGATFDNTDADTLEITETNIKLSGDIGTDGTIYTIGTNVDLNVQPNGTGVISVSGTTNYEDNVTDDDDIPNKKYVDDNSGGGGDVFKVGTPLIDQVGVWTGDGTLEGDANLTFDGLELFTSKLHVDDVTVLNSVVNEAGNILTIAANGEIKQRTPSEILGDIGAGLEAEVIQIETGTTIVSDWLDGDIITLTLTGNTTLAVHNIKEGKTSQIRITEDGSSGFTLALTLYSDAGSTLLTQKVFGTNTAIDVTLGNITKIIHQRFGSVSDISYVYEN